MTSASNKYTTIAIGASATLLVIGGLWYALRRSQKEVTKPLSIVVLDDLLYISEEERAKIIAR